MLLPKCPVPTPRPSFLFSSPLGELSTPRRFHFPQPLKTSEAVTFNQQNGHRSALNLKSSFLRSQSQNTTAASSQGGNQEVMNIFFVMW
ncbi:hypothetical protein NC652_005884 [Populus alba x Populus x berolinensis]|nr:hypothetical protein NC652_005881 [Populus alba x Populus x berolinensis]KAJ6954281.1 hypothetical protein NC652_005884 [Populus alba x Populus x berolinensis]